MREGGNENGEIETKGAACCCNCVRRGGDIEKGMTALLLSPTLSASLPC